MDLLDPKLRGDPASGGLVVAGDQHRGQLRLAHGGHRLRRVSPQLVAESEHADGSTVDADGDDRAPGVLQAINVVAQLC